MIKKVNEVKLFDELEDRLLTELEEREEYGCWSGYCEKYCPGVYV